MVDSAYFVKSFQHFADIYFSKCICISVCGVGVGGIKLYLLPCQVSFVLDFFYQRTVSEGLRDVYFINNNHEKIASSARSAELAQPIIFVEIDHEIITYFCKA